MSCGATIIGLAAIVYVLCMVSSTMKYYMKFIVYFVLTGIASITLPIPVFILRPRHWRNALWPAACSRLALRLLGNTYEVRGIENVNRKHGSVVLMNHQSCLDLAILAYLWPIIGRATAVAKHTVLYSPFGVAGYLWGTLYINRSKPSESKDKLNSESRYIKERAAKLLFFPEGTRNDTEKLLPFKRGPFHIAIQSQSNIQPVVISRYTFLDGKRKTFHSGHAIIDILPEISCEGLTKDDLTDLLDRTQVIMQAQYDKLNKETKS